MPLQRDDLIKQTHRWVLGACIEWNETAKQFAPRDVHEFRRFVERVHTIVVRFLRGQQTLDGTCSDLECTLALEAKQVFGLHHGA